MSHQYNINPDTYKWVREYRIVRNNEELLTLGAAAMVAFSMIALLWAATI